MIQNKRPPGFGLGSCQALRNQPLVFRPVAAFGAITHLRAWWVGLFNGLSGSFRFPLKSDILKNVLTSWSLLTGHYEKSLREPHFLCGLAQESPGTCYLPCFLFGPNPKSATQKVSNRQPLNITRGQFCLQNSQRFC